MFILNCSIFSVVIVNTWWQMTTQIQKNLCSFINLVTHRAHIHTRTRGREILDPHNNRPLLLHPSRGHLWYTHEFAQVSIVRTCPPFPVYHHRLRQYAPSKRQAKQEKHIGTLWWPINQVWLEKDNQLPFWAQHASDIHPALAAELESHQSN